MHLKESITFSQAKLLAEAGQIREAIAIGQGDSFAIKFRIGMIERALRATNSPKIRRVKHLSNVARMLKEDLGIPHLSVELAGWEPEGKDKHAA